MKKIGKGWSPLDVIILILTATISLGILISILVSAIRYEEISADKAKTLAAIINSTLTIISLYVGSLISLRRDEINKEKEEEDDNP